MEQSKVIKLVDRLTKSASIFRISYHRDVGVDLSISHPALLYSSTVLSILLREVQVIGGTGREGDFPVRGNK